MLMTLVVARKNKNKIIINSDTQITYPKTDQNDPDPHRIQHHRPSEGLVKTINIASDVNLSFAGTVAFAEKVLSNFNCKIGNTKTFDLNNLIGHLNYLHVSSEQNIDFILSIGDSDPQHTKIIVIKDGAVSDVQTAWIGNHSAFRIYQKNFLSMSENFDLKKMFSDSATLLSAIQLPSKDQVFNELYLKTHYAMREVVLGEKADDVGGFVISSVYYEKKFKYCGYFDCHPIGFNRTKKVSKQDSALDLGSPEEGSYAVSVGGSCTYNLPIYFPHGKFGMIYTREDSALMEPILFYNKNAQEFKEIVRQKKIPTDFSTIDFTENSVSIGYDK